MRSGPSHFYYVFDALGSGIALTDGSGSIAASYTYEPFGNAVTASGAQATVNPFRFASGYFDSATGLTKFGDRYYDSSLGRWAQHDSIAGSIANPNAMDRYVYAGDSPVNLTDPSGRFDMGIFLGCTGAISGLGLVVVLGVFGHRFCSRPHQLWHSLRLASSRLGIATSSEGILYFCGRLF
jgi:RHS repeat-associated protein